MKARRDDEIVQAEYNSDLSQITCINSTDSLL